MDYLTCHRSFKLNLKCKIYNSVCITEICVLLMVRKYPVHIFREHYCTMFHALFQKKAMLLCLSIILVAGLGRSTAQ